MPKFEARINLHSGDVVVEHVDADTVEDALGAACTALTRDVAFAAKPRAVAIPVRSINYVEIVEVEG